MSRIANRFIDPADNLDTYFWPINHSAERAFGKERSIEHGGNTGGTGLVRQQGDESPMVIEIDGTILTQDQYDTFWEWFALSKTQTIYFRDFQEQKYEVTIISFLPVRVGAVKPVVYWTYTMRMEVIKFKSGVLFDQGVSP